MALFAKLERGSAGAAVVGGPVHLVLDRYSLFSGHELPSMDTMEGS